MWTPEESGCLDPVHATATIDTLEVKYVQACRQRCEEETAFFCKSFTFAPLLGCQLSDTSASEGASLEAPCVSQGQWMWAASYGERRTASEFGLRSKTYRKSSNKLPLE